MKRVAFLMQADPNAWLGALSYLRNLLRAVVSNPDRRIEPVVLAHPALAPSHLAGFPEIEIQHAPLISRWHPVRLAGALTRRMIDRDIVMETFFRKYGIDALSHSHTVGAKSAVASIGWIPDFQHIRMPQYFSRQEREARDRQFMNLVNGSRRVILSSDDARKDFAFFAPHAVDKACVLHFVSCFEGVGGALTRDEIYRRYEIDRPYFHLPNQFWAHKNHAVVIEALGILKRRGINALVLATGKPYDHRDAAHFDRLMAKVKELGVEDGFRVLGVVTLPELQALMLNAISLINPSNFEGWSTTVEESKSLGLPIILSDIPVHLEQAPVFGRYFKANSAEDLAEIMQLAMREYDSAATVKSREIAALALPERIRQFGKAYEEIAYGAITGGPSQAGSR